MRTSGKKKAPAPPPLMVVVWKDAESDDEWRDASDYDGSLPTIRSVGFLLRETPLAYVLAQNVDSDNESVSMVMTIPKAWVVSSKKFPAKFLK